MDPFLDYLNGLRNSLKRATFNSTVHFVIGNESCDLDSTVSALTYAHFLKNSRYRDDKNVMVIPVLNATQEDFLLRTLNCFVLNKIKVDVTKLVYTDTINLLKYQENFNLKVTLVDHHVLPEHCKFLEPNVVEIFDHRPQDPNAQWCKSNVDISIEPVGSCATLIAVQMLNCEEYDISQAILEALYDTIIFDTVGFKESAGKAKQLDYKVITQIEILLQVPNLRAFNFNDLWDAHNDVSHLTTLQLLKKDLKTVQGVLIPGLPMLVRNYLKKPDAKEAILEFLTKNNAKCAILMGLEVDQVVRRDLAIYAKEEEDALVDKVVKKLVESSDFQFRRVPDVLQDFQVFEQQNVILSRKQLLPIIKEVVSDEKA